MEQTAQIGGHRPGLLVTQRHDTWWFEPMWTGLGFLAFSIYTTIVMLLGSHYYAAPYLSPMYSPLLFVDPSQPGAAPVEHAWFGLLPHWSFWPSLIPLTPAMFVLIFPLAFRLSCYYYRKFYYRAYFLSPPACAVGPMPQRNYRGERGLLVIQNLHRYALYAGIFFIVILSYDAVVSYFKDGKFGVGVGSILLTVNPILLGTWTFGCHAFRHLIGGRKDCFSCDAGSRAAHGIWKKVSWLNARHMAFAWISMLWVWGCDVYVRLVSMGLIHDYNTWN